jgi:hypothetical protein
MVQLWTIHGFLKVWNAKKKHYELKQFSLLYVLMSRRTEGDYKAVLKFIKGDVFNKKFEMQEVVGDFEKAVWRAVQDVLPGVTIKGCGFHWSQCLLRKMKNIGMTKLYKENVGVRDICKQLMSLKLIT